MADQYLFWRKWLLDWSCFLPYEGYCNTVSVCSLHSSKWAKSKWRSSSFLFSSCGKLYFWLMLKTRQDFKTFNNHSKKVQHFTLKSDRLYSSRSWFLHVKFNEDIVNDLAYINNRVVLNPYTEPNQHYSTLQAGHGVTRSLLGLMIGRSQVRIPLLLNHVCLYLYW